MKRRRFTQNLILSSAGFAASSSILTPQKSDAIIVLFLLRLVGNLAFDAATGWAITGLFNLATGELKRRRQEWFERRREAQFAQEQLVDKLFRDVYIAETVSPEFKYFMAAVQQGRLGTNLAFSFPRILYDEPQATTFTGPAAAGLAGAAQYFSQEGFSNLEIQKLLLPPKNAAGLSQNQFGYWEKPATFSFPTFYRPEGNGLVIFYEPIDPRPGGKGVVKVIISTRERRDTVIEIDVRYAG